MKNPPDSNFKKIKDPTLFINITKNTNEIKKKNNKDPHWFLKILLK